MNEFLRKVLLDLPVFTMPLIVWLIFFVLIYLIFRIRYKHPLPFKKWQLWVSWILSSPIAYFVGVLILIRILSYTPSRQFTAEEWVENPEKRVEYIDDLVESRILYGLSESEVKTLLGEPLENCQYFASSNYDMIYNLGPERGFFRIDSDWLLIWLENGVVKDCKIGRD